jgi:hypothetical protein
MERTTKFYLDSILKGEILQQHMTRCDEYNIQSTTHIMPTKVRTQLTTFQIVLTCT